MHDSRAQATTRREHPGRLRHSALHVVHVVQREQRRDELERCVGEWEGGGIGHPVVARRVRLFGVLDQRRRGVHADDVVAVPAEVARESALAAAEVEREPGGRRQQCEEAIAVKLPVAIVARPARPGDPVLGFRLPGIPKVHGL